MSGPRPCCDPAKCCGQIAVRVPRCVEQPPLPTHAEEVARIHRRHVLFEEALDEIADGGESGVAPPLGSVELGRETRRCPDVCVAPEPVLRRRRLLERLFGKAQHQRVVRGRSGVPRDCCETFDHHRVANRPVVSLLGAHREADHELQPLDPEGVGHESVLRGDIVSDRRRREAPSCCSARMRRRRRAARADDEPACGIEGSARRRSLDVERARQSPSTCAG